PSVKATLAGIRRMKGTAQRRVRALVKDDLLALLLGVGQQGTMRAARDRALLLVGFAGAFRRSELVALTVADLNPCSGGIEVNIKRSKTDQEGKGRTVFLPAARGSQCPVAALNDWLAQTGIAEGPIFRSVGKSGLVGAKGLSAQSVGLVVKDAVRRVSGDKAAASVAGHSLRSGFCTEAAAAGLMPWQIRAQTGHTTDAMLARYIRPAQNRAIPSLL
ncbi:MAG: site-specific integrase, partial [Alphaproteobacteria bacterium]